MNFNKRIRKVDVQDLEFVISMHYEDLKMLDVFHYHLLWNPLKITLQYPLYHLYSKNIISHDDYLIYDDGGMSNHLKMMLSEHPRDLKVPSVLTPSFSRSAVIEPELLENPTLFYCGMKMNFAQDLVQTAYEKWLAQIPKPTESHDKISKDVQILLLKQALRRLRIKKAFAFFKKWKI
jgi:hypothetical protein